MKNDPSDMNNYCAISTLPIFSKVFEKVMQTQLYNFLERFNVLHRSQYGFRKWKSTSHAIMDNLEYVYENLDQGNILLSLFLDINKAFNWVDHVILLAKLLNY